jgi:hypothetical protein
MKLFAIVSALVLAVHGQEEDGGAAVEAVAAAEEAIAEPVPIAEAAAPPVVEEPIVDNECQKEVRRRCARANEKLPQVVVDMCTTAQLPRCVPIMDGINARLLTMKKLHLYLDNHVGNHHEL